MNVLPIASEEQLLILNELDKGNNIKAESCPGSGKTTMSLLIAKHFSDKKILSLTYSKKLKFESKEKALHYGISNIEIHSFHAAGVKFYNSAGYNDIRKCIDTPVPKKSFSFEILIIDESQDITRDIYHLICKIIKDNANQNPLICVLGDTRQNLFLFKGSDSRYITFANLLFKSERNWSECRLSQTFRLPLQVSEFINKCVIKCDKIKSNKTSTRTPSNQLIGKPRYHICDPYGPVLLDEVNYYFSLGYEPEDIFILAPSLRSANTPARNLANELSAAGVNIYYGSEDDHVDDEVIKGKLLFLTNSGVKGMERKVVIQLGYDAGYFKYFDKDADKTICPNTMYVAVSRSLECLSLIHSNKEDFLPFLDISSLNTYCDIIGSKSKTKNCLPIKTTTYTITDFVRHLDDEVIDRAIQFINVESFQEKTTLINIESKLANNDNDLYESVAEITGIAVPAYHQFTNSNEMEIYKECIRNKPQEQIKMTSLFRSNTTSSNKLCNKMTSRLIRPVPAPTPVIHQNTLINFESVYRRIGDKFKNVNFTSKDSVYDGLPIASQVLYIANLYDCYRNNLNYKMNQISSYDWLSDTKLEDLRLRLDKHISSKALYEVPYSYTNTNVECSLNGRIDCICEDKVYEFKCKKALQAVDILQIALYMLLMKKTNDNLNIDIEYKYYLFNILDENIFTISGSLEKLELMFEYLHNMKNNKYNISDSQFLTINLSIKDRY
jgi:hypothetical protein